MNQQELNRLKAGEVIGIQSTKNMEPIGYVSVFPDGQLSKEVTREFYYIPSVDEYTYKMSGFGLDGDECGFYLCDKDDVIEVIENENFRMYKEAPKEFHEIERKLKEEL